VWRRTASSTPIGILSIAHADAGAAVNALVNYNQPDAPIAEVILDQQVASGIGNVFRSEILWACEQHPFAPVSKLATDELQEIVDAAVKVLRTNVGQATAEVAPPPADLAVYGRNGQRCRRCGDTVEVRRTGRQARLLYWCPGCQIHRDMRPSAPQTDERPMDPHPAAAKFLAELPWRRNDKLAG
jgi:endonuclease-8